MAEQGKVGNRENILGFRSWIRRNWDVLVLLLILLASSVYFTYLTIEIFLYLPQKLVIIMVLIVISEFSLAIYETIFIIRKIKNKKVIHITQKIRRIILIIIVLLLYFASFVIIFFQSRFVIFPIFILGSFLIKIFPSAYWLQHCYGINYYWFWINFANVTEIREILVQEFNQMNIPFNETTINVTIEWIRNLTNYAQEFSGISVASTSVVGFIGLYLILSFSPSLIANYFLSRRLVCDNNDVKNDVKNDLCINVLNQFFLVHFFRWFLLYMVTFSLIIYFSLIFLITSEYISLVLMIVTTFLVIIVEFFVSREDTASRENMARGPFVGPLVASIIAAPFFALMVFMIANVFLPSTCFAIVSNTNIGSLMNSIASSYALLLILAAIFGAIPYASTLWAIQYHYECSCPPAKKQGKQRSSAGGSKLLEEM
ncbi:hypothetical protein B7L70_02255 [Vulcanisaeta sp. EB80]|nr:hypothetical protein B7L70_02255 [Vulcanisaeta sp. EB80]